MKTSKLLTLLAVMVTAIAMAVPAMADLAAGVTLDFNANDPASGVSSSSWKSLTADASKDWTFGTDVTLEAVSGGTSLSMAYRFTGGTAASNTPNWENYDEGADASWELWIKPDDTGTLDSTQTIFESGGTGDGISIWYEPGTVGDGQGTIKFTIDNGSNKNTVSAVIDTSDFRHIVMTYDRDSDGSVDLMQMYVDGALVGDNTGQSGNTSIHDWTGSNGGGLGNDNGNVGETAGKGQFDGDISIFRFWELKALTAAEVTGNFDLHAGASVKVIYPEIGGVVPLGDVTLEWENLEDPCSTDPVYVQVGWGTDPNRYNGGYTIAAAGDDLTTATITLNDPGVYYWYVDNTFGAGGADPCTIEGKVNMFTNDGQIEVADAGADMVTWVDNSYQLEPNIVDDGSSTLTYNWTISTPNGLTAVIDNADIKNPTVTFTKYPYEKPNLINPSFEDPMVDGKIPGWTGSSGYVPGGGGYTNAPDGANWTWVQPGRYASQVLYETVQAGATYTLSAVVGWDSRWGHTDSTYIVQLLAGSGEDAVVIAEDSAFMNDPVNFYNALATYTNDPVADADLIGKPLEIRLVCDAGSNINAYFDNVVLTSDQLFDPLMLPAELTLTAQDGTNGPVSDTMTIEVYSDKCLAARLGLGMDLDSDYNKDCLINAEELAAMAAAWLTDTSATDFIVAEPGPELAGKFGILDVTGINPATGEQWAIGDQYRLAFVTGVTRDATDPNIATYDAFVQSAAEAAGYVGATWKCVAATYDNIAAGGYGPNRDANVGRLATELPTYLVDGSKLWNEFLNGNLATTYSVTETGGSYLGSVATGAGRVLGDPAEDKIENGDSSRTDGAWWRVYNHLQTSESHFYAVSEPLTVAVPIVDAGDKISTWLGKEITMAPKVGDPNDPTATFDYNWTASPNDDPKIDVAISDPSIETPTVTVTKVPYFKPFLPNGSFEIVTNQGGQVVKSYRDYWGQYDRPAGATVSARQYVPNTTYHFPEDENTPPDGDIICRANTVTGESRPDGPAILLGDVAYDPTATYELSVAVGHPHAVPDNAAYNDDTWRGYLVQLVVGGQVESTGSGPDNIYGGTVVAEDPNSIEIPRREWRTSVVTLAPSPELADLAGQPIQIRLLSPDDPDPEYFSQTKAFFDNVVLKINGEAGEYVTDPGMVNVTMTLTVNKQGETEVASDKVKVDVYENACEVTKAVLPETISVTDHNIDCITNLVDFADLAADWLLDYSLIEAKAKP